MAHPAVEYSEFRWRVCQPEVFLPVGLAKQIGLEDALRKALPFNPTSPNATDPVEIILAFMAGVLVGSRRLAHIERLRWDEGVRTILGVKRFVSDTTMARFLGRFTAATVTTMFESLLRWEHGLIKLEGEIRDLDSSIVERYGKQEGAWLGYNPKKHRRPCHHPLLATLGQRPWVVHSWLRSGNTTSATGVNAFLEGRWRCYQTASRSDIFERIPGSGSNRF